MPELLTGRALAGTLYEAGLAPEDTHRSPGGQYFSRHAPTPHEDERGDCEWQPWCCLCCVAHLIERFKITINYRSYNGKRFWSVGTDWTLGVDYVSLEEPWYQFSDIPAVISRVALACAARESEAQ